MKKANTKPHGKQQPDQSPARLEGVTELTDQDLQQVQGGLANQAPVEKSKKGSSGDQTTPPPK